MPTDDPIVPRQSLSDNHWKCTPCFAKKHALPLLPSPSLRQRRLELFQTVSPSQSTTQDRAFLLFFGVGVLRFPQPSCTEPKEKRHTALPSQKHSRADKRCRIQQRKKSTPVAFLVQTTACVQAFLFPVGIIVQHLIFLDIQTFAMSWTSLVRPRSLARLNKLSQSCTKFIPSVSLLRDSLHTFSVTASMFLSVGIPGLNVIPKTLPNFLFFFFLQLFLFSPMNCGSPACCSSGLCIPTPEPQLGAQATHLGNYVMKCTARNICS